MELADETPLVETPPEAYAQADAMRQILSVDLPEMDIAEMVFTFDAGDMELQLHTWPLLSWKEQDAWRQYRQMWTQSRRRRG